MRFSLFGIPIHVRPIFWLVVLMLAAPSSFEGTELLEMVSWVLVVFVSILVHELGHAFAMRAYGRSPSIELWGMGGLTSWGDGPEVSRGRSIIVSLAGPGAGFMLALPIFLVSATSEVEPGSLQATVVEQALWVNVGWGLVNLLPILPLDGGRVMESGLASVFGTNGPRFARYVSLVAALGAGAFALANGMIWAAMIAALAAMYSYRTLGAEHGDGSVPAASKVDPTFEPALAAVWGLIQEGKTAEAVTAGEALLESVTRAGTDIAHVVFSASVLESIAWAHIEAGEDRLALATTERLPPGLPRSPLLAARLLYGTHDRVEGLRALERAFHDTDGELAGLVLAAAYIECQRPDDVVAMMRTIRGAALRSPTYHTVSAALFYADCFEASRAVCELAWNRFKKAEHAYNAACACARMGQVDEGLDWLERALGAGFADTDKLENDEDLAALRGSPRFGEIVSSHTRALH